MVVPAGGCTVRASRLAVSVSIGSEGRVGVGSLAVAVPPANTKGFSGGGIFTTPGAWVNTRRGRAGSSTAWKSWIWLDVDVDACARSGARKSQLTFVICSADISFLIIFFSCSAVCTLS